MTDTKTIEEQKFDLIIGVDPGYLKTAWTAWLRGRDFPYQWDYSFKEGKIPGERMNFHGDQFEKSLKFIRDSACGVYGYNKHELRKRTKILIYSSFLSVKSKSMTYFLGSLGLFARVGSVIALPENIDLTKMDTQVRKAQTGWGRADYPLMTRYLDQFWVGKEGNGLSEIPLWRGVDEDIIASGIMCKFGVDTFCGPDVIPKIRNTGFVRVIPNESVKKEKT